MKLLDTAFLIHYWGGVDDAADYLETHEDEEFLTTTRNLKEIAVGRRLQGNIDRAEILDDVRLADAHPVRRRARVRRR